MRSRLLGWAVMLLTAQPVSAQGWNNIWYMAYQSGLDFNTDPPSPRLDGRYAGPFACASICTADGNLICYFSKDSAYNGQHAPIMNGHGFEGYSLSGILVPWPGGSQQFFLVDTQRPGMSFGSKGLVHVVEMTANAGAGAVTQKNVVLLDSASNLHTAVPHSNGIDYWVVLHEWGSDRFMAYLVDATGISAQPVASAVGEEHYDFHPALVEGFLKASLAGDRLAIAKSRTSSPDRYIDLFDLDASTGVVSSQLRIASGEWFHSVEFSPNGQVLYATLLDCQPGGVGQLLQFDLSSGDSATIAASRTLLHAQPGGVSCAGEMWNLAMGPNGKVYVATLDSACLGVVDQPDVVGMGCDFDYCGQSLGGRINNVGLPNQIKVLDTTTTGIGGPRTAAPVLVWPNPASDGFWVEPSAGHGGRQLFQLLDLQGRVILSMQWVGPGPHWHPRSGLASGSYIVRLSNLSGALLLHGKVVLE